MPTVIFLDTSSEVNASVKKYGFDRYKSLQMAISGLEILLDQMATCTTLEYVALVTYTYSFEIISQFTRNIDAIKNELLQVKIADSFNIVEGVKSIDQFIVSEWGNAVTCNVVVIVLDSLINTNSLQLPLSFPGHLIIISLSPDMVRNNYTNKSEWLNFKVKVYQPDLPVSKSTVEQLFTLIGEIYYSRWIGNLVCGNFNSKITLAPTPEPYVMVTDFDINTYTVQSQLDICGFVEHDDIRSPASVSRHLVLPYSMPSIFSHKSILHGRVGFSTDSDDDSQDEGEIPSFCILLHGALKVENMSALVQVAPDWYGILFSWADSKKKFNLMLSLLEPGPEPVSWLGNLNHLTIKSPAYPEVDQFPLKAFEKKTYSSNCVAWIRQAGFQNDIQKILRHARKLPEKTLQFYKELNRVRRAAICLGFLPLIDGLAAILERECTTLPGTVHPACAFQLSHAAGILREPYSRDPKYVILPMKMSF